MPEVSGLDCTVVLHLPDQLLNEQERLLKDRPLLGRGCPGHDCASKRHQGVCESHSATRSICSQGHACSEGSRREGLTRRVLPYWLVLLRTMPLFLRRSPMMAERLAATLAAASFLAAACLSLSGAVADKDSPKIFLQCARPGS